MEIVKDSKFLMTFFEKDERYEFEKNESIKENSKENLDEIRNFLSKYQKELHFDLELLIRMYNSDLDLSNDDALQLIEILNYLDNKYLDDILLLLKHYESEYIENRLNPDLKLKYDNLDSEKDLLPIFIERGNYYVVDWLYKINEFDEEYNFKAFQLACVNGQLRIAKLIYSVTNFDIHKNKFEIFNDVCMNGQIKVAKWMYSLENIKIKYRAEFTFVFVCMAGYLSMVEWLYSIKDINNVNYGNVTFLYAFKWACINGHLDIALFLSSHKNIREIINKYDKDSFALARKNEHLDEICMLVFLKNLSLTTYFDDILHEVENKKFLEVKTWLHSYLN